MHLPQTVTWYTFNKYQKIILITFLLCLCARAQTIFNPLYAIDTYSIAGKGLKDVYQTFLSQGRFGLALVYGIRDLIGYQGFEVSVSANILATLMMSASGSLLASAIVKDKGQWPIVVFALIFALHPYGTEFFHFSEAAFGIALGIFISSIGIHLAIRENCSPVAELAAILLIVFSLSIYQTVAAVIIATCLMGLAAKTLEEDRFSLRVLFKAPESKALLITAISLLLYGALAFGILFATGIKASSRANISSLFSIEGLLTKFGVVFRALWIAVWTGFGILGPSASSLLAILLVASLCVVVARIAKRSLASLAITITLIIGAFIVSVLPPTLSSDVWLVPRTLWAVVVPISALISLGWLYAPSWGKQSTKVVLVLLSLIYIGVSNRMIMDQRRVNHWDSQQSNRIIARLEALDGFSDVKSVAIVGGHWGSTSTTVGDMNISALFAPLAKVGLLREATGYRFAEPTKAQLNAAKAHCSNVPIWPNPKSVTILGSVGIVCLSKN